MGQQNYPQLTRRIKSNGKALNFVRNQSTGVIPRDELVLVQAGYFILTATVSSGECLTLQIYGPGCILGEFTLARHEMDKREAVCISKYGQLISADLKRLMDNPGQTDVARELAILAASRHRDACDMANRLAYDRLDIRIAAVLLDLADKFGESSETGVEIQAPLTHETLARLVGVTTLISRPNVSRVMHHFKQLGWIAYWGRRITIIRHDELRGGYPIEREGALWKKH